MEEALVYAVPLAVLMYDECLEIIGVTSGAANRRVNAVGVLVPLLSADVVLSTCTEGSSTSFSALGILAAFNLGGLGGNFSL